MARNLPRMLAYNQGRLSMEEASMDGRTAPRRPTVLVMEPEQLLRWSLATYLGRFFTILAVESLEEGCQVVRDRLVDAIVVSDDLAQEAETLSGLVRETNPTVTTIRMVARASAEEVSSDVVRIEKPFELPALVDLLRDNLPKVS